MIGQRIVRDAADTRDLLETYSDGNFKLRQVETGKIYGASVVDTILGYRDGVPYGRFTYEETDVLDDDEAEAEQILNIITGVEE